MPGVDRMDTAQPNSRLGARHFLPGIRVLLALDGRRVSRDLLERALPCCRRLTKRLDVVVVQAPLAPTFLLGSLLIRLERHGIDYRLTSAEGGFGDAVLGYLRRFQGIRTVVLDRIEALPSQTLACLQDEGYRLIAMEPGAAGMGRSRMTA